MAQVIQIKRTNTANLFDPVSGSVGLKQGELGLDLTNYNLYAGTTGVVSGNVLLNDKDEASTAETADKLTTPRTITLAGSATGSTEFDGSANVTIQVALSTLIEEPGKFVAVQVGADGRITGAATLEVSDLPLTFDGTPSADNKVATQSTVTTAVSNAKTELIGESTTGSTANTIRGGVDEAKGYTDTQIASKISSVYKPAGSVAFAELVTPSSDIEGNVYNVTDGFTADAKFVESEQGHAYPAGTNVVCIEASDGQYAYDVLSGFIDTSSFATTSAMNSAIEAAKTELTGTAEDETTALTLHGIQNLANSINTELTGLEGQVIAVQGDVADIKGDITTIESNVTNITNEVAEVKDALGITDDNPTFPENIVTTVSAVATATPVVVNNDDPRNPKIDVQVSTNGNGLSVTGGAITISRASTASYGTVKLDGTVLNTDDNGVLSILSIDGGLVSGT